MLARGAKREGYGRPLQRGLRAKSLGDFPKKVFLYLHVLPYNTTEVGVRDMCPSSAAAPVTRPKGRPKITVAMRQMTSIVGGAGLALRVGRPGV